MIHGDYPHSASHSEQLHARPPMFETLEIRKSKPEAPVGGRFRKRGIRGSVLYCERGPEDSQRGYTHLIPVIRFQSRLLLN